ncbi:putative membrane protein [Leptospira inadai serovar Lyme str. 10]|uniref:Integral membrane protein n=2 Tax=Leptospira inadai serovar Lyme TaxID=293084 RepID=A0ABX4YP78_9LEPT|nr:hypothetical protein [Leptospira inadai]EQA35812.1 putative membrane protein [Leptospira inadai serovar Lyme str. 10]PNV76965.1 hypothetical protein BES34_001445 [Leptospira inadai serovar Lyme]
MEFLNRVFSDPDLFGRYTLTENILLLLGVVFWAYMYLVLVIAPFKSHFVEMPVFIACGNIIWEFLWGFVIQEPMGAILLWGYRLAFVLDVVIFYHVIRYGKKQLSFPISDIGYRFLLAFLVISWGTLIYAFHKGGYDLFTGSNSAYILNLFISGLYPLLFIRMKNPSLFSYPVSWAKLVGNAFFTVFLFLYFPMEYFVLILGVLCFIADSFYLINFKRFS